MNDTITKPYPIRELSAAELAVMTEDEVMAFFGVEPAEDTAVAETTPGLLPSPPLGLPLPTPSGGHAPAVPTVGLSERTLSRVRVNAEVLKNRAGMFALAARGHPADERGLNLGSPGPLGAAHGFREANNLSFDGLKVVVTGHGDGCSTHRDSLPSLRNPVVTRKPARPWRVDDWVTAVELIYEWEPSGNVHEHAREGDIGQIEDFDESGNPIVWFEKSGTSTIVFPDSIRLLGRADLKR